MKTKISIIRNHLKMFRFRWILLIFFCTIVGHSNGQENPLRASLSPKAGAFFSKDFYGGIYGVEASIRSNRLIYSVDYFYFDQTWGSRFSDIPEINQLDVLAGLYFGKRKSRLEIQGGVGLFWGTEEYSPSRFYHYQTIAFPFKVEFKIKPVKFVHLGIGLYANSYIDEKMVYAPVASIGFGK